MNNQNHQKTEIYGERDIVKNFFNSLTEKAIKINKTYEDCRPWITKKDEKIKETAEEIINALYK